MTSIKTITGSIEDPALFDRLVNEWICNGWKVTKRYTYVGAYDRNSLFVAELEKEMEI